MSTAEFLNHNKIKCIDKLITELKIIFLRNINRIITNHKIYNYKNIKIRDSHSKYFK